MYGGYESSVSPKRRKTRVQSQGSQRERKGEQQYNYFSQSKEKKKLRHFKNCERKVWEIV